MNGVGLTQPGERLSIPVRPLQIDPTSDRIGLERKLEERKSQSVRHRIHRGSSKEGEVPAEKRWRNPALIASGIVIDRADGLGYFELENNMEPSLAMSRGFFGFGTSGEIFE